MVWLCLNFPKDWRGFYFRFSVQPSTEGNCRKVSYDQGFGGHLVRALPLWVIYVKCGCTGSLQVLLLNTQKGRLVRV